MAGKTQKTSTPDFSAMDAKMAALDAREAALDAKEAALSMKSVAPVGLVRTPTTPKRYLSTIARHDIMMPSVKDQKGNFLVVPPIQFRLNQATVSTKEEQEFLERHGEFGKTIFADTDQKARVKPETTKHSEGPATTGNVGPVGKVDI